MIRVPSFKLFHSQRRSSMKIRFHALYLILILALVLTGCGGGAPSEVSPPPTTEEAAATEPPEAAQTQAPETTQAPEGEPSILHIGWLGVPDTLNPAYAFLVESYQVFDLIYGTLTVESPTGEYVGLMADKWTSSEDGLVWTFTLKDNIKWHNGEDFTADQMAWAINAVIQNPDGWATSTSYVSGFVEAAAPDAKTVQITLEKPISNMEYRVSFLYAVYPPDFEAYTTPEDLQNFPNDQPIGTGAFKLTTFDKDKGILIFDSNEEFYGAVPKVDQVIFQTFDNADAMVQAIKVGDLDATDEVPNSAFETLKNTENVKAIATPGRSLTELIINSVPADHDPAPNRNPALEDPQVRLAIATAIDKQDLVDIVLQGLGAPATTIIPPALGGGFWHSPIEDVTFDLDKANQILEEAGYVMGSDGVRTKGDVRLEFRLQYASDSTNYPRIADLMAEWFRQVGMKANVEAVDPDSLTSAMTPVGDYDLGIWGWGSDPDPDFMLSVMTSEQFVEGGWSDSGYSNPEYDQLYLDQQTVTDRTERQKIVWQMQDMVFNDRPYVLLYYDDGVEAYRTDRFTGFIESPIGILACISLQQVEPVK
jgi:peptide/nickel transport system substrate-binding protein